MLGRPSLSSVLLHDRNALLHVISHELFPHVGTYGMIDHAAVHSIALHKAHLCVDREAVPS
jgi:hypothetical protein